MIHTWNITGVLSEEIDSSESRIFFAPHRFLPKVIIIELWGVILHTASKNWPLELTLSDVDFDAKTENVFIAGLSRLIINDPIGGDVSVTLYDKTGKTFLQTKDSEVITLQREWKNNNLNNAFEYLLGGTLDWPEGNCEISIFSPGAATFEFDSKDCVPLEAYLKQPFKFMFH